MSVITSNMTFNVLSPAITTSTINRYEGPDGVNPYAGPDHTPQRQAQLLAMFTERMQATRGLICVQELCEDTQQKLSIVAEKNGYGMVSVCYGTIWMKKKKKPVHFILKLHVRFSIICRCQLVWISRYFILVFLTYLPTGTHRLFSGLRFNLARDQCPAMRDTSY